MTNEYGRYDNRFAAGRCSAAIHCPQNADLPAHPRFLEGEGLGNDATALILYRFAVAAVSDNLFSFGKARDCSPPLLQAKLFGDRRWLDDAPPSVLGRRSTHGDRALDPDAVSCLLAFRVSGRFRRAVTVAAGALHQLERSADDQRRYAAPGIFFWDFFIYQIEGIDDPGLWPVPANTADETALVTAYLRARGRLSGTQQHGALIAPPVPPARPNPQCGCGRIAARFEPMPHSRGVRSPYEDWSHGSGICSTR